MGVSPLSKSSASLPRALVLSTAMSCKELLTSCKGRDKFLAVIQFTCAVYRECMKDYLEANRLREAPIASMHAKAVQQSLKSSRKMFKLFKFISEMSAFEECCKKLKSMKSIHTLKLCYHALSFIYYIFDNVLWFESIGVAWLSAKGDVETWKWAKDLISMFRAAFKITIAVHQYSKASSNLSNCISTLTPMPITPRTTVVSTLLKLRFQQRMRTTEVMTNLFRLISLVKSLELPGHEHLSTIFVCICRWTGAVLSVMKVYFQRLEGEKD